MPRKRALHPHPHTGKSDQSRCTLSSPFLPGRPPQTRAPTQTHPDLTTPSSNAPTSKASCHLLATCRVPNQTRVRHSRSEARENIGDLAPLKGRRKSLPKVVTSQFPNASDDSRLQRDRSIWPSDAPSCTSHAPVVQSARANVERRNTQTFRARATASRTLKSSTTSALDICSDTLNERSMQVARRSVRWLNRAIPLRPQNARVDAKGTRKCGHSNPRERPSPTLERFEVTTSLVRGPSTSR